MIRKPRIGKKVVILDSSKCCCSPLKPNSIGKIVQITKEGCLIVHIPGTATGNWWHCKKCLGPYKKRSLK